MTKQIDGWTLSVRNDEDRFKVFIKYLGRDHNC